MPSVSRLRWLCRRGMKELDLVLGGYLEHSYATAGAEQQACFQRLLEMPDPDLYRLLLAPGPELDPAMAELVETLRGLSKRGAG